MEKNPYKTDTAKNMKIFSDPGSVLIVVYIVVIIFFLVIGNLSTASAVGKSSAAMSSNLEVQSGSGYDGLLIEMMKQ